MSTWRPLDGGDSEPRRVSFYLDGITRRLGGPSSGILASVFSRWEQLVGPDIAGHARPVSLRQGVLVLAVDHPAWAVQLRYMADDLRERICETTGSTEVSEIQLRVSGGDGRFRPR